MLKKIAKRVHWEVKQAEDYVEQAYIVKHDCPSLADLFITLANDEMTHAEKLIREGNSIIDNRKIEEMSSEEHYNKCKTIWAWEERIAMDCISDLKVKISHYRQV